MQSAQTTLNYNWFSPNKGADKQGAFAGIPYDGNDPRNYDLYVEPHPPVKAAWAESGNAPPSILRKVKS